jgi:hypothetical protein
MKRLVKDGLVTTLIGLGILIFSGMMMWSGKASAESLSGWITAGLMFLRSKDSLLGLQKRDEV